MALLGARLLCLSACLSVLAADTGSPSAEHAADLDDELDLGDVSLLQVSFNHPKTGPSRRSPPAVEQPEPLDVNVVAGVSHVSVLADGDVPPNDAGDDESSLAPVSFVQVSMEHSSHAIADTSQGLSEAGEGLGDVSTEPAGLASSSESFPVDVEKMKRGRAVPDTRTVGLLLAAAGVLGGTGTAVFLNELASKRDRFCKVMPPETQQFALQMMAVFVVVLVMVESVVIVPGSFELAVAMGHAIGSSASLTVAYHISVALGALLAGAMQRLLSSPWLRSIVILCLLLMATLQLAMCAALHIKSLGHRVLPLLLCRIAGGVLSGALVQLTLVAALRTMPRKSMMLFTVFMTAGRNIGMCFGFFLCSALLVSLDKIALPLLAMSIFWALVAAVFTIFVPPDLASLHEAAVSEDERDARLAQAADPSDLRLGQAWLPDITCRMWTVGLCIAFSLLYSTSLGLLEVSSNLMLQASYGWSAERVCYVLGVIGVSSTVFLLLSAMVLRRCRLEDSACLVWLGGTSVLATIILFSSPLGTFRAMAIATLLIDASVFTMSGIADGLANKSTIEGTTYSLANFNMARASCASLARALAAPLSHAVLNFGSRNAFAGCLALLLFAGFILVKRLWVLWDPKGHPCPEMAHPPSEMHREEEASAADPLARQKAFVLLEEALYPELTKPSSSQGAVTREDSESRWSNGTPTFGTDDDRSLSPFRSSSLARPGRSRNLRELCPPRRDSSQLPSGTSARSLRDSLLSAGRRSLPSSLTGAASSAPPSADGTGQKTRGKATYARSRGAPVGGRRADTMPTCAVDQSAEAVLAKSTASSSALPLEDARLGSASSGADVDSGAAASSEAESSFVDAESAAKQSSADSSGDADPELVRGKGSA